MKKKGKSRATKKRKELQSQKLTKEGKLDKKISKEADRGIK